MNPSRIHILLLCTGNRARSIMAEGIANGLFGDVFDARSAGSRPNPPPHWRALELLGGRGVSVDGLHSKLHSKGIDAVADQTFDAVVTLCDSAAADACPIFPGAPLRAHWSLPDPADVDDEATIFEQTFAALIEAIETLAAHRHDLHEGLNAAKRQIERRLAAFR